MRKNGNNLYNIREMKYISAMNDIFWHFQLNSDTMSIVRGVQLVHLMLGDDISTLRGIFYPQQEQQEHW